MLVLCSWLLFCGCVTGLAVESGGPFVPVQGTVIHAFTASVGLGAHYPVAIATVAICFSYASVVKQPLLSCI